MIVMRSDMICAFTLWGLDHSPDGEVFREGKLLLKLNPPGGAPSRTTTLIDPTWQDMWMATDMLVQLAELSVVPTITGFILANEFAGLAQYRVAVRYPLRNPGGWTHV